MKPFSKLVFLVFVFSLVACSEADKTSKKERLNANQNIPTTGKKVGVILAKQYKKIELVCSATIDTLINQTGANLPITKSSTSTKENLVASGIHDNTEEKSLFTTQSVKRIELFPELSNDPINFDIKSELYQEVSLELKISELNLNKINEGPRVLYAVGRHKFNIIRRFEAFSVTTHDNQQGVFELVKIDDDHIFIDETSQLQDARSEVKRNLKERLKLLCVFVSEPIEVVNK